MREDTLRRSPSSYGGKSGRGISKIVLLQPIARFVHRLGLGDRRQSLPRSLRALGRRDGRPRPELGCCIQRVSARVRACAVRFRMIGGQPLSGSDRRLYGLDVFRSIAVLFVVTGHTLEHSTIPDVVRRLGSIGGFGVEMFFVLERVPHRRNPAQSRGRWPAPLAVGSSGFLGPEMVADAADVCRRNDRFPAVRLSWTAFPDRLFAVLDFHAEFCVAYFEVFWTVMEPCDRRAFLSVVSDDIPRHTQLLHE